nr:hypothetical protein [Tanacetum cinerariifolium]
MPIAMYVSTREPKRTIKQSAAKPLRKTVSLKSNQKPRNITRKLYKRVSKACRWWYPKFTPSEYKWTPKSEKENVNPNLIEIVLFIVDSGCSKHMTGNLKLLINFVEKFLGLNHNLFSVGQFCDADLEVAFRKSTCYIRDLKGNDLLTDHLCSSCEFGKAKQKSFHSKITPSSKRRLQLLHKDLCGPMRVAIINGKRYVLVIVDDYSRYTWTHFLRSKDDTPEVLIDFLRLVQRGLHAQNRTLVEAARTMLSTAKVPLFLWAEAIATTCFTQPFSHHVSSDPAPECQRTALEHDSLSPGPKCQDNVTQEDRTVTTSNELDLLFSPMFDELLNGSSQVVSKSFAVT